MARTNYVLIDFESVQPKDLGLLVGRDFKIKVFVGAQQSRLPLDVARAIQAFGTDAEYIQIEGQGKNALDFHIAFYIGRLAAATSDAFFHIISEDKGFDPLIKHLKTQKILSARSITISELPLFKAQVKASVKPDKLGSVIEKLKSQKASKPGKLKTLRSTIKTHLANKLEGDELERIIETLTAQGIVTVSGGKVTYSLPN